MSRYFDYYGQIYELIGEIEPGQTDAMMRHVVTGQKICGDLWEAVEVDKKQKELFVFLFEEKPAQKRKFAIPKSLLRAGLPARK